VRLVKEWWGWAYSVTPCQSAQRWYCRDAPQYPDTREKSDALRFEREVIAEHGTGAFADDFGKAGRREGFHNRFGRDALGDGGPIELQERAGFGVARDEADDPWKETIHVESTNGESGPGGRTADLEHQDASARLEDAVEFTEERDQVFDVTQGVAHANEIECAVAERKSLAQCLDKGNSAAFLIFVEHAYAGIQAHNIGGIEAEVERGLGGEAGAGGDIQQAHFRLQSGAAQGPFAVRPASAEGKCAGDAVVVAGGVVKEFGDEFRAALRSLVKLREIAVGPDGRRWFKRVHSKGD